MPVYKDEKGRGTWYVSVRYEDWKKQRKTHKKRGFLTKREALNYERDFLAKSGSLKGLTVESLFEEFQADYTERLRPSTVQFRNIMFSKHIIPIIGHMKLDDVTPNVIRKLIADRKKVLAPSSLSRLKNVISSMFAYAITYHGLTQNPCSVVRVSSNKDRVGMNIWTPDEFERAMNFVAEKYKPLLYFLFYSGARFGEALALTFGDIDGNTVQINKTTSRVDGDKSPNPPKTKNAVREVTIPSFIFDMIKRPYGATKNDRVFPFVRNSVKYALDTAAKKAGLPHIRVHDLRHSHASYLVSHFPVPAVSKRLGHANANITMSTYAHALPHDVEGIALFLETVPIHGNQKAPGKGETQVLSQKVQQ